MIVAIDGVIYEHAVVGGIARTYNEILPRMCDLAPDISVTIATSPLSGGSLPRHAQISSKTIAPVSRWFRPKRIWRQIPFHLRRALLSRVQPGEEVIWHSTYYSLLPRECSVRIVSVYDLIHELMPEFFEPVGANAFLHQKRQSILEADCLLCNSATTQHDLCEYYGIDVDRIRVALLAPSSVFRPLAPEEERTGKPYFLYVGKRGGYKNFDGLLFGFATWSGRKEVDLVAVGPPWTDSQWARLDDLGVKENVRLLRNVDDQALCKLYNDAAAFVHPSLYEGFGIPLLEAMACGCPVIASNIPSSREIADGSALFFNPNEPESIHDALDAVLEPTISAQLAQAGFERKANFSWLSTAEQTLAVYRDFYDGVALS